MIQKDIGVICKQIKNIWKIFGKNCKYPEESWNPDLKESVDKKVRLKDYLCGTIFIFFLFIQKRILLCFTGQSKRFYKW